MSSSSPTPHPLRADLFYGSLKDHLIASTGLAYYDDRDDDLASRIAARMENRDARDCAAYLDLLRDGARGESELDTLIEALTIGETFFFRHLEVFDALRDHVFPDVIARNQECRRLRIWSAGCSTGAEPYSVAILLQREFAERIAGWEVSILGTDVNREFLARAREGRFEEWAFRSTPVALRRDCFVPSGRSWLIAPAYKERVSFQYHNLVKHPFPSLLNNLFAFDLILCRNVTIYFSHDVVRKIVEHFRNCLVDGGWLAVGHAEPNVDLYRSFRAVNVAGATLYQKSHESPEQPEWLSWSPMTAVTPPPSPKTRDARSSATSPPPTAQPAPAAATDLDSVRRLADVGDLDGASSLCQALLEKDRLNPSVHLHHALVLEQLGRHAETEKALRRAIYLDRNYILAHYYLGLLQQKQGEARHAARSFRNVLQLLSRQSDGETVLDADELTVAELRALTQRHLEVLQAS